MKKECYGCKKKKPLDEFAKKKCMNDGHQGMCKDCKNMYDRIKRGSAKEGDVLPLKKVLKKDIPKPIKRKTRKAFSLKRTPAPQKLNDVDKLTAMIMNL